MAQAYATPDMQVPPEVYNQAANYQLGELTGLYKPRFANALMIVGIALGVTILDIIVFLAILIYGGYIFYILIVIPIVALIWMFSALPYANLRVYTFAQGLVHARGQAIDAVRWDQIEAVWAKATRSRNSIQYIYTVRRGGDGKTFTYRNHLQQVRNLGATIQQRLVQAQMPRVIPAYNAGQNIAFGAVNVNMQGLNNGKEMVPWSEVGSIVNREGTLNIEKDGRLLPWKAIKVANVPNFAVLQALVQYVVKGPRD
ncbi:MAG TPA: DUF6585 family protein [Ktedonobacteraceae bacterium]|jgi:hypothetical protein|nr:DUF6585 family protein [Ktedonobacteraceae bacterium]